MVKAGGLAAAAAAIAPQNAEALVDYAGLPYLGGAGRVCLFVVCVRVCVYVYDALLVWCVGPHGCSQLGISRCALGERV